MYERQKSILMITEWADDRFNRGVARYAKQAEWHLLCDNVYSPILPWGWKGDGCIAMVETPDLMKFIKSLDVPVITLSDHRSGALFPGIHQDDRAIGVLAANYFQGLGFKHFACYSSESPDRSRADRDNNSSVLRSSGFSEQLKDFGFEAESLCWDPGNASLQNVWVKHKQYLIDALQQLPKPTAIFCIDDRMAVNVIDACVTCGIDIPGEVAVLGVGNLDVPCECSAVPVSSIRIDFEELGYKAASMLGEVLAGTPAPKQALLLAPDGIEERRSTYTLAIDHPAGGKAIRFMLDHFDSPISVSDVAAAGGLERRQLNYICKQELGKGPATLLEDMRMKKALKLLASTNYTIARVAIESGLGNALRLQRIFQKRLGTSPGAWRKAKQNPS